MKKFLPLFCILTAGLSAQAHAQQVHQINISPYVNYQGPTDDPNTGLYAGNQGTGLTFDIPTFQGTSSEGTYVGLNSGDSITIPTDLADVGTVYTLINTRYGIYGVDNVNVTFSTSNGLSATFALIGGSDVRDYNNFVYTNTINGTTTRNFWSDGQTRQDVQTFVLPTSFDTETLTGITIATAGGGGYGNYQALLTGVDYSNAPQVAPAGAPAPLAGAGILSFFGAGGIAIRKRAKRLVASMLSQRFAAA